MVITKLRSDAIALLLPLNAYDLEDPTNLEDLEKLEAIAQNQWVLSSSRLAPIVKKTPAALELSS